MPTIRIISPTPGPTTTERILELLNSRNQGVSIKELCHTLNRPISMVQRCLKLLMASGQVYSQLDDTGRQLVYFERSRKLSLPAPLPEGEIRDFFIGKFPRRHPDSNWG